MEIFESRIDLPLENGSKIKDLKIAYHHYGSLNAEKNNVIWVFHAISGNSDVLEWWPGLFGEGKIYDPSTRFIICVNSLGSPYGSSRPDDLSFPQFSIRDVVLAHQLLAEHLQIDQIHTVIGASFGGNQALEFAYSFTGTIERLVLIASSARESAWGIAIHESQRLAMESDPSFGSRGGGKDGMRAARSMAMLNYRTSDSFIQQQSDDEDKVDDFSASSYIRYQGEKFVERFDALCYYYLTKCLDTHNLGRGRGGEVEALSGIHITSLIIGIDSDQLIPIRFQKFMAEHIPQAQFHEIHSVYGHDGFLVETDTIAKHIQEFDLTCRTELERKKRKVLKFGGRSLANDRLDKVLHITAKAHLESPIVLVVSARAESTDRIYELLAALKRGENIDSMIQEFLRLQEYPFLDWDSQEIEAEFRTVLKAVELLGHTDESIQDRILAFGERYSARCIAAFLESNGISSQVIDSNKVLKLYSVKDEWHVDWRESEKRCRELISKLPDDVVPVVTGFFAGDEDGNIRTLGRNGTNYSATLIARFIEAEEVQNWTDVDGIFTADPRLVANADPIHHLSYREANELANFGVNVLHSKTILPLINSDIPLRILNTAHPDRPGTRIDRAGSGKAIKAVSLIDGVSLIRIEGKGLSGKIGIDARIFTVLSDADISIRLISQASSERGIGFIIDRHEAVRAERLLLEEFEQELLLNEISTIDVDHQMAIIAIVGRHNYALEKAIQVLRKNKVWMHLISNSISGEHISLVVSARDQKKALRLVHSEVFGAIKTLNVFAFGKGTVGGRFIDQILETHDDLSKERDLQIQVVGVADSGSMCLDPKGLDEKWREQLQNSDRPSHTSDIIQALKQSDLENIVIVDNTSSAEVAESYEEFIRAGFDLVASNKKSNSMSMENYSSLRSLLKGRARHFYYETNVGAGLPVIDTLKQLRQSADKVKRIRGVFSGSLSYLFNSYCSTEQSFSKILNEARSKGLTEPDPREDLSGMDVARKLVILAREVGMNVEFEEVTVEGLVPESMKQIEKVEDFLAQKELLDSHFDAQRDSLQEDQALRYVGDLDVEGNSLTVSLVSAERSSPLGSLKNADSIFEIYTDGYGDHPIVIQGAGAGAEVTARGVYSDLLRVGMQL